MIKTLSTYNLLVSWVSPLTAEICSSYQAKVYIWSGEKASPPAEPTYSITKENLRSSGGTDRIQIGRLVNDYLDFNPQNSGSIGILNVSGLVWVKTEIIYTTSNPLDDGEVQSSQTQLALKGYGYGNEGENPQPPSDGVLIENDLHRVSRNSRTTIGLLLENALSGTVESFPSGELNYPFNLLAQTNSNDILKLLNIPSVLNDDYITITIGSRVINLVVKDEFRYDPVDVYFINKNGSQQSLTFFKERRDTLNVTKDDYESFGGQPSEGYHQYQDYNVNGRTDVELVSGFVPEASNGAFKQLFLSSKVYIYNGSFIPVNIGSSSLSYKTKINDRLISYSIQFKYSFSEINNL